MNIVIAKANTHSDVAKEQHLVPRTYMRQWSYNNTDSIYIFNKRQKEKAVQPANVNSINYIVGFHDIKAGDIFVPDEALEELFGFVSRQCKVIYEGRELDSLRKLNDKFLDYDKWEIFDLEGVKATRKERNEIRRVILQSIARIDDLPLGRYYLVETKTIDGFVLDDTPIEADLSYIDQNKKFVFAGMDVTNERQKVQITVTKTD